MRARWAVSVVAVGIALSTWATLNATEVKEIASKTLSRLNEMLWTATWTVRSWGSDGTPVLLLHDPSSIYVDSSGRIFISERRKHQIRVLVGTTARTYAGTGSPGLSGDGQQAIRAELAYPEGLAGDGDGNLYVADSGNDRIRRISLDGRITTVAGGADPGYSGDGGPAVGALLKKPFDIAITYDGIIYIADTGNHCIRRIGTDGMITTVAGTGEAGYSGDGGPASEAMLNTPFGIAVDDRGRLYIADSENHRVRRVLDDGRIVTIAGTGLPGFSGDGGPADLAQLHSPQELFVTRNNEIFVVDEHNHRIRRIDSTGTIETVAGNGYAGYGDDGTLARDASLNDPESTWVYPSGSFLIADGDNNVIRLVDKSRTVRTILARRWVRWP